MPTQFTATRGEVLEAMSCKCTLMRQTEGHVTACQLWFRQEEAWRNLFYSSQRLRGIQEKTYKVAQDLYPHVSLQERGNCMSTGCSPSYEAVSVNEKDSLQIGRLANTTT